MALISSIPIKIVLNHLEWVYVDCETVFKDTNVQYTKQEFSSGLLFFSHFNCENWLDYTVIWENIFETCYSRPKDDCASQSNGKNWVNDDNYVKERKHEILNK